MNYVQKAADDIHSAIFAINPVDLESLYYVVYTAAKERMPIVTMGNGGSAAVAEHLSCDWTKGVGHDKMIYPRVHSLVSNQSLITAIANDYGYEQIFAKQIEYLPFDRALVLGISSSGNSPNIIKGFEEAVKRKFLCAAMVGFDGGRVRERNFAMGLCVHVKSYDYGVVEDSHSIIMHAIATRLKAERIGLKI